MDDAIDGPRLAAYLMGQCSAEEAAEIERWLAGDPARGEVVQEFARVWELARGSTYDWDTAGAWRDLLAAHEARRPAPRVLRLVPSAPSPRRVWLRRLAAAVVLTAATGGLWYFTLGTQRSLGAPSVTPDTPQFTEVATRPGERVTFRLVDGTRVELGVASRLRYARTYGRTAREVYLEGEAYFAVPHDERKPFAVHTARAVARDLGTAFGVRAYADAGEVEVVVTEGLVALHRASPDAQARPVADSVVLTPADLGRLDRADRLSVERGVDVAARLAWREGRLVFRRTPLRDVLPQLNRWYGAELRLGDAALGDTPLTATIAGDSLTDVLRLLTAALHLRAERQDSSIVLHSQPRAR